MHMLLNEKNCYMLSLLCFLHLVFALYNFCNVCVIKFSGENSSTVLVDETRMTRCIEGLHKVQLCGVLWNVSLCHYFHFVFTKWANNFSVKFSFPNHRYSLRLRTPLEF